jgi:IS30 family transposase
VPSRHMAEEAPSSRLLSLLELQRIATPNRQGLGARAIAECIGRAPSTVSRELHLNVQAHECRLACSTVNAARSGGRAHCRSGQ